MMSDGRSLVVKKTKDHRQSATHSEGASGPSAEPFQNARIGNQSAAVHSTVSAGRSAAPSRNPPTTHSQIVASERFESALGTVRPLSRVAYSPG